MHLKCNIYIHYETNDWLVNSLLFKHLLEIVANRNHLEVEQFENGIRNGAASPFLINYAHSLN